MSISQDLTELLEKQARRLDDTVKYHLADIKRLLNEHRQQVAHLVIRESPEPFVRAIFDQLRQELEYVVRTEAGCADSDDARCLLKILNRMESSALEGKSL